MPGQLAANPPSRVHRRALQGRDLAMCDTLQNSQHIQGCILPQCSSQMQQCHHGNSQTRKKFPRGPNRFRPGQPGSKTQGRNIPTQTRPTQAAGHQRRYRIQILQVVSGQLPQASAHNPINQSVGIPHVLRLVPEWTVQLSQCNKILD